MADEARRIDPAAWADAVAAALAGSWTWFDLLTCVDELGREPSLRVVLRLERPADRAGLRLETLVPREAGTLASVADLLPGAAWREREVAEFFGMTFVGGDPRPLLSRPDAVGHVLRKDAVLAARALTPWPGAKEPGERGAGRRRLAPAGVPDPAVWGERTGAPASADEIAAALGGRVRGGRR